MTLKQKILNLLKDQDGLTDRSITDIVIGQGMPQQSVNQCCRTLERSGYISRVKIRGLIRNYINKDNLHAVQEPKKTTSHDKNNSFISEDMVKKHLEKWLICNGWKVENISWGKTRGTDITATKNQYPWLIEVKGEGSREQMRVNYFLSVLGEILQRMDEPNAYYSIAFPDLPQFRRLWERLPTLAKQRTGITALFVTFDGIVTLLK